ncbi:restriction endonuclease subunit S [Pseudomonas segetis]|uniref:Type I restriction enzyme, S subunit n=1 Tax=Pseudomonas segetis TaxID=298908 RepID=A0A239GT45_9PSED|nr:restriction endonuclease subunit S [Pseudomonas segetis]SNS72399.1 type I restriction enzyme, S subunit [Pseudomonas segetis]
MTNLSGANLNNRAAVGPQGEGRDSPSRFSKYPAYKESGVEWLGEVPEHWESRRLKFLFSLQKRPVVDGDGIVTCFRDGAVTLRSNRRTDGFTNAEKEIGYQGIRKGDLVIHAMDAFAGAIGVSDSDGKSSPVYSACTPNEGVSAYYYARLLRHMALAGFVSSLAKGIRERSTDFRWSDASEIYLPFPSISEQTQIAHFLDHETARIDALIEEQQRLIELLKEKRQAVISHAVTKGLDPTVPMKDSGVEWLGEVPAHWVVLAIKWRARIKSGDGISPDLIESQAQEDKPHPVIGGNGVMGFTSQANVSPPLIVIGRVGALCGNVHKVHEPAWVSDNALILDFDRRSFDINYLVHVLDARNLNEISDKSAQPLITGSKVTSQYIPCPGRYEQLAISKFLEGALSEFDQLALEGIKGIELLKERRSALISAAVTGKIDVRGWQPPTSAPTPELAQEAV